ncbi:MAG: hypothetical protein L3J13_04790, partial [Devosiaceae bacterium]|nr:hypothetical protein [Devosiaceae bacterium]
QDGRGERYVTTNSMDGQFKVDWLDPDTRERGETKAALKVCKNCLESLNWRGYKNAKDRMQLADGSVEGKNTIWASFDIAEFLMDYSTFFHSRPSRNDDAALLNEYVEGWPKISERKRRTAGWKCEQCKVNLSEIPGSLHCHHLSGVVTDNSDSNLSVLCAICHAKQPHHQHMNVTGLQKRKILKQRAEQEISLI